MKRYRVSITDKALADMAALHDYIALELQAPQTAMKQYNRIAEAVASLSALPERCGLLDSEPERSLGMRLLQVENYSVIYIVSESEVTVLRVLYSASDLSARLREN